VYTNKDLTYIIRRNCRNSNCFSNIFK